MKKCTRFLSVLLALAMILSMLPTVFAAPAEKASEDIVILYTNDIHTYIGGTLSYDNLADMKKTLAEEYAGVLLVDAGDHVQGTAYGSMDKGATIMELMEKTGYDLATLGNHEFDYGMERALEIAQSSAFPYVSSNFYHEAEGVKGETVLEPYQVLEAGGKKIAFVGITTPESFTKSTPAYFQDEEGNYIYGIAGGEDGTALYADVQAAIDAALAEGVDYVIALGHLGDDPSSQPWTSEELIANTTGLDAFIDGHSHSIVEGKEVADKNGDTVLLTQTGEYFGAIGKMTISAAGISTERVTEWTGSDAQVKEIKDAWLSEITTKLGEVIGSTELTLSNYNEEGNRMVRKYETNTGDFAADALYYLFDVTEGLDVDVAIMNGGGIRNSAITGELSYLTCKNIHTFGNVACLQTVTGQQIIDALEWGARSTPTAEVGGFLQVAGLTYTVDATIESTVQQDDKAVWTGGPTGEYRVKDVKVFDKESGTYVDIDPEAKYNLAGYNYTLRDLGDGFAMFEGAVNVKDYVMEDYMVLANYIKGFPEGVVEAQNSPLLEAYPNYKLDYATVEGSGRIEVLETEEEPWDGVITIGGLTPNLWTTKYGNVYTDCYYENFFEDLDLDYADLVTVKFLDQELILPVVPNYSYVDSGKAAVLVSQNEQGNPTGYVFMAINMGNFLDTYGIAYKGTDESGNWYWTAYEGVEFPIVVTFELYEKEGYMAEYLLHEITRTNNREDYADLTDAEFANFREVTTTGMGEKTLYRSSSPINPELNRSSYADAAMEEAGVKTVVNLADSEEAAAAYPGFADTYYSQQNVKYLNLGVDFAAKDFQDGLAEGLRFMAENEGPYLVHCTEGKDRAGFVNALLSCLMGGTAEEVIADYMVTYYNYYGIVEGDAKYDAIANSNIKKSLANAFAVADITAEGVDLAAEAEEYILAIGLSDEELSALKVNLGAAPEPILESAGVPSTLREGASIPTYVTLPGNYSEDGSYPVVFMIHGHGGNHNEWGGYDSISNGLAKEGIIAVTLDFPGCGASTESFTLNTMTNMKQDVLDVIAYVTENYSVDEDAIGGFGYSMGGRIILELTAEELYAFDTIEFVAPAEDLEDLKGLFGGAENWEVLKAEANENGFVEFTTIYATQQLSKEWFADLEKYPDGLMELAAEKFDGVSMTLWATDDTTVNAWISEGVAETFNSIEMLTYTNGHSYGFYGSDPYTKRITTEASVGFFAQELFADETPLTGYVKRIEKDGSLTLLITEEELEEAGIVYGDVVELVLGGYGVMAIYNDAPLAGYPTLVSVDGELQLLSTAGSLAEFLNLAALEIKNPGSETEAYEWYYEEGLTLPLRVSVEKSQLTLETPFTDVDKDAWYYEYVAIMADAGFIQGMTETTFEPESNITRAQFATLLYRITEGGLQEGWTEPFEDVNEDDWFYKEVTWAYNVGVVNGVSPTEFDPNEYVTREQIATMLHRFTKAMDEGLVEVKDANLEDFEDGSQVSEYALEAILWLTEAQIMGGSNEGGKLYINPQNNATRAEATKLLMTWILYLNFNY